MKRLPNLKTAADKFKKVSVTLDYTIDERNLIKKYLNDAKKANEDEPSNSKYEWKVRGDPKNGLVTRFLRRVKTAPSN